MNDEIMMQSSSSPSSGGGDSSSSASHYVTSDDVTASANYNNDVTLTVMTTSGHEQHVSVSKDITVRKLKQLCIPKYIEEKRFNDFAASGGACVGAAAAGVSDEEDESRFKLIHTKTGKCLTDSKSLSDQSVSHSDALLLLPRKPKPPQYATLKASDGASRPSPTTISELTNSLPFKNESRCPRKDSNFNNYLSEMRKIILSLIHVSHRLLCYNKEAVDMFREATALLKANRVAEAQQSTSSSFPQSALRSSSSTMTSSVPRSAAAGQGQTGSSGGDLSSNSAVAAAAAVHVDPSLVTQLTDMGFKESLSKVALIVNEMNVAMATEWLLSNGDDESLLFANDGLTSPHQSTGADRPASMDTVESPSCIQHPNGQDGSVAASYEPMDVDFVGPLFLSSVSGSSITESNEGLKILQEFHRLSFKPDAKALRSLIDMGFPPKDSHDALRINGNNQNLACEWLLSCPRKPTIEEWKRGIDPNSSMYKAIVTNPLVQLLLNNPKILLALEDILDHPNSMSHYLNDPDAGPLLVQISSIYSTERHADGMNSSAEDNDSEELTAATAVVAAAHAVDGLYESD